jgi:hypothetical protein
VRAYIRPDTDELLLFISYRTLHEPRDGRLEVTLETGNWTQPQRIPLLDYTKREDVKHRVENGKLILEDVHAGVQPAIITLKKAAQ